MGVKADHDTLSADVLAIEAPVAVVIVNYRTPDLAKTCVEAVSRSRSGFRDLRVMLVDGGSADGSAEKLAQFVQQSDLGKWVDLLALAVNGGFGWANNQAILRLLQGSHPPDYIHLLNPDAEVDKEAIAWLARYLTDNPTTGAVGSQLLDPDGSLSGSAFVFPSVGSEFARGAQTKLLERLFRIKPISIETNKPVEVDWVTGASVMFRVAALRDVGLFDEGFFLYHEEVELMWRLRKAGWVVATEPRSRVWHVGGVATGISNRVGGGKPAPRKPIYLYRSRARFFGLAHGRTSALLAFTAWLVGHAFLRLRRVLRLAGANSPVDRELRDHLIGSFPRAHDCVPAVTSVDAQPSTVPAWMRNRWL